MPGIRCLNCFHRGKEFSVVKADTAAGILTPEDTQNECDWQSAPRIHGDRARIGERVARAVARFGKQRPSGGFLDEEGQVSVSQCKVLRSTTLPVETLQPNLLWSIKGVHLLQAYVVGLRCLDSRHSNESMLDFPMGRNRLLKQKLIVDLLQRTRDFQSLPASDISATQPDLQRLSFQQLLRLRVILMDVSVSSSSSSASAFVERVDVLVQRRLAEVIGESLAEQLDSSSLSAGEVLAIIAAACSFDAPSSWWVWWLPHGARQCRTYLNVRTLTVSHSFPKEGVLEISDFSKRDQNHFAGCSIWMDWQVRFQRAEADIRTKPPLRSTQAGIAGLVSAEVLEQGRGRLRSVRNSA